MSWAIVLSDTQIKALAVLLFSAAPSAHETGIWHGTVQALGKFGLLEPVDRSEKHIEPMTRVTGTPGGFRAWADIVEARRKTP